MAKRLKVFSLSPELHEKCAVFGVYTSDLPASHLVSSGLWALQHRGQEATGISASDGHTINTHKGQGLVACVITEDKLKKLPGHIAIGHNRYSTFGGESGHIQPVTTDRNLLSLAHNGNLPTVTKLKNFLEKRGRPLDNLNDSDLMQEAIESSMEKGMPVEEAIKECFPLFTGAFSLAMITKDKLIGVRDAFGIRPLCIGVLLSKEGFVISSETCGLDSVGAKYLRDVRPGEMVIIDKKGLHSYQLKDGKENLDIFEFVYFARPDSIMMGKNINEVRRRMGKQLALENTIEADIVIPVPNSAIPAALGYAEESGTRFDHGLLKNSYIHRTFITPSLLVRQKALSIKLIPLENILKNNRVVIIDDSIVRGATSKKIVDMVRKAGAKEVHLLIASPPVKYPDYYGIATPTQKELIASYMSVEQIRQFIGADSLSYLSFKGMLKAIGLPEGKFCTSCFTGKYPIPIGDYEQNIQFNI